MQKSLTSKLFRLELEKIRRNLALKRKKGRRKACMTVGPQLDQISFKKWSNSSPNAKKKKKSCPLCRLCEQTHLNEWRQEIVKILYKINPNKALGYPPGLSDKTLLKMPHTLVTGHSEITLELNLRYSLTWLTFIVIKGMIQTVVGENSSTVFPNFKFCKL